MSFKIQKERVLIHTYTDKLAICQFFSNPFLRMQALWRSIVGKEHLLDQNPLLSDTTIPEADWDKRLQKRMAAAVDDSEPVRRIFRRIQEFATDLGTPGYDYFPDLIQLLYDIARAEGRSQVLPEQKRHVQLAMELTNYLKKILRRRFILTAEEARELERDIVRTIRPAGPLEKGYRPAGAPAVPALGIPAAGDSSPAPASPASAASPAPSPASASPASVELGSGGYGVVIKPALPNTNEAGVLHEYPGNVTKLFIQSENRDKILALAPLLDRIMGPDEGHRINTYRQAYKGRNVPESSRRKLGIREGNNVFPIRMPDLGISVSDILDHRHELRKLRSIPVTTILGQIVKVLKQVQTLQASGYIHGDIRDTNVMIHPDTGTITIIDFDLLRPVAEFRRRTAFGMYNNPPEIIILHSARASDYVPNFYTSFTYIQEQYDGPEFIREMEDVIRTAEASVDRMGEERVLTKSLTTFDSFGIGCTLLTMLQILYPGCVKGGKPIMKVALEARITNNGTPYTDAELDAIVNAIYDMSHSVLLLLAKFRMDFRPKAEGVLDTAVSIERNLRERLSGSVGNRVGGKHTRRNRKTSRRHRQ